MRLRDPWRRALRAFILVSGGARKTEQALFPGVFLDDRVARDLQSLARAGTAWPGVSEQELHDREEALRFGDEQLRLITENVPAMIVYFDVDFICRFSNSRYAEFFGLTRHEILGRRMVDVIGAANFEQLRPQLLDVLAGKPVTYDRPQRMASGELRHIRVSFVPDMNAAGEAKGSYALVTDITEHKEAEQAIQTHALHQEAIALYGQYALENRDTERADRQGRGFRELGSRGPAFGRVSADDRA